MKYAFAMIATLGLSACMGGGGSTGGSSGGGGGGGGVDLTPDAPDAMMNTSMGSLMNGVRSATLFDIEYSPEVGQAAQDHANDMLINDYTGTTGTFMENGMPVVRDGADTARQVYNVTWNDFLHMVARGEGADGDGSVESIFNQWTTTGSNGDAGPGSGQGALQFNAALQEEAWDLFGLGKAGTGADARWMLILLDQ